MDNDGSIAFLDCNDDDATTYPGAEELCDSIDNNCDGAIDEIFDAYCDLTYVDLLATRLDANWEWQTGFYNLSLEVNIYGNRSAGSYDMKFYLSTDTVLDGADVPLLDQNNASLPCTLASSALIVGGGGADMLDGSLSCSPPSIPLPAKLLYTCRCRL